MSVIAGFPLTSQARTQMLGPWWGGLKFETKLAEGKFSREDSLMFGKRFYCLSAKQELVQMCLALGKKFCSMDSLNNILEDEIFLQADNPPLLPLASPAPTLPTHGPDI